MRSLRHFKLMLSTTVFALFVMGLSPAGASSANISHSYGSTETISAGSLVSLDPLHSNSVLSANTDNGLQLLGVAVDSKDSLIAVDSADAKGNVQVATSGTVNALVSDVNGAIAVGDAVSVSPFSGVGMKALLGQQVIGLAQTAFALKDPKGVLENVTDRSGKISKITVGYVSLSIAIGSVPSSGSGVKLNILQQIAKSLTGRTVSTLRAGFALVVAVTATVALIVLIYASIYGGIVSIGRNPLAKYVVFRSLLSVLGMAALTALTATVSVYLILR